MKIKEIEEHQSAVAAELKLSLIDHSAKESDARKSLLKKMQDQQGFSVEEQNYLIGKSKYIIPIKGFVSNLPSDIIATPENPYKG